MKQITVRENGTKSVKTIFEEPSRTQQHFKEECDVNKIMAKYKKGLPITHLARAAGAYADLTSAPDYLSAMQTVINAETAFMSLPSEIRKKFNHDPAALLQFIEDPKNRDECVKMGIFDKKPVKMQSNDQNEQMQSKAPVDQNPTP